MKERQPEVRRARRRDWVDGAILTCFLWSTIVVLYLPLLFARHPGEGIGSAAIEGATVLVAIAFGMLLFWLYRAVGSRPPAIRAAALFAGILAVSAAQTVIDFAFTYWVAATFKPHWPKAIPTLEESYRPFFTYICLFAFNIALFQLVFLRRSAALDRWQLAEARLAAKQAELTALRFQLNPHFLFNSLNAISSLIVTQRYEEAEEMTVRLSSFLRHSLLTDPAGMVPLETELATIEEYLEIERVRFGDLLQVEIDAARASLATPVPSFILQPLVENAIKHGLARASGCGVIGIAAEDEADVLHLRVINDIAGDGHSASSGTGVGLVNVEQRLRTAYGPEARLQTRAHDGQFEVLLVIPKSPAERAPAES